MWPCVTLRLMTSSRFKLLSFVFLQIHAKNLTEVLALFICHGKTAPFPDFNVFQFSFGADVRNFVDRLH